MIYEVEGDILHTGAGAIAHGVAANDPMNQGLAAALHKMYPAMHKDFHHWCSQQHPKLGSKPRQASVSSVNHALRALRKIIADEELASIALPRLATGVGGLDWAEVQPLIRQQLADSDADIYVYQTYVPGQKAAEPKRRAGS